MCIIYLFFYRALKAQGFDRKDLPVSPLPPLLAITINLPQYVGWAQPYCAWFGLGTMIFTVSCYGYATFLPGWWDIGTFFSYYTMCFVCPILYVGWKLVKKSKVVKAGETGTFYSIFERNARESFLARN